MDQMRMDPKHQFAAQFVLSRAANERREREALIAAHFAMQANLAGQALSPPGADPVGAPRISTPAGNAPEAANRSPLPLMHPQQQQQQAQQQPLMDVYGRMNGSATADHLLAGGSHAAALNSSGAASQHLMSPPLTTAAAANVAAVHQQHLAQQVAAAENASQ